MKLPKRRLFDYTTPGPGVEKDAPPKKGIALFGDILYRRFWKMVSLNLLYLLFSIPSLIIYYFASYGVLTLIFSEYMVADTTMASTVSQMSAYAAVLFLSLFGGGASTAGMTYVIRNYTIDTHAWVWADFIRIYKSRFLKATGVFAVDLILIFLSGINFWFYGTMAADSTIAYLLQGLMLVVLLILLLMHAYIYPVLAAYKDKSVFEIYKNAFILAIGKLPRTAGAILLCTAVSALICFLGCFVTIYAMLLIPFILFTFVAYLNLFITNPVSLKYLGKTED